MAENYRLLSDASEERRSDEEILLPGGPSEKTSFRQKLHFLEPLAWRATSQIGTWALALSLLVLVFVTTAGAYHFGTRFSYRPLPVPTNLGSCGATSEEGQRKGCVFDFIIGTWVRPECLDHTMYKQYISEWESLNISMFSDPDGLHKADKEYTLGGHYELIYSHGTFHYLHCIYTLEKRMKLLNHELWAVPSNVMEEEHINHCLNITGKPSVPDITDPALRPVFLKVPIVDCLVYRH
ncbi:uncharacterized protein M421DRAFT_415474 [Didymella exigua CBS 183.55]|uniref:Uncharacterized protein n=1 Tax=Didymella exigua CBS 183.55 TaxID=1150837 RepID=A0A6A5S3V4_9PLEO|nr:uncharacterized protein M421DRAFT_415474 [Didymella exigua CBS 183.55]KAF1934449.1 hypothetical protein M421DRAFT_415474 [Didymella exigua CBS 183.55]